MGKSKEFQIKAMARSPRFAYLPEHDRHVMATPTPTYRINVIGCGMIGQEHIHITHLEGRATIHGVYDPSPLSVAGAKTAHSEWSNEPLVVYETLEEACNDPDVDALIISTPNYTHLDVLKVAVQSGKHILLEKPISTTVKDAVTITEIAENYESVLQVGLQYRYKPFVVEALHEVMERGTIGEMKLISMQEHRFPFLDKVKQWNKFAQYSGDTLIEKCCHYFDLLNLFARSRPCRVYATGNQAVNFKNFEYNGEKADVLDNAFVIIDYENGVRANFSLCMFAPMLYEELIICGDEGRIRACEQVDFAGETEHRTELEIMLGERRPSRRTEPTYPSWIQNSGHSGATYYEHVYFIDNMNGEPTNTASAREGLWSIIVAAAAQASIKRGQAVIIDEFLAEEGIQA